MGQGGAWERELGVQVRLRSKGWDLATVQADATGGLWFGTSRRVAPHMACSSTNHLGGRSPAASALLHEALQRVRTSAAVSQLLGFTNRGCPTSFPSLTCETSRVPHAFAALLLRVVLHSLP